jgi:glycosyltransferase involved in cell wall biosynthesis
VPLTRRRTHVLVFPAVDDNPYLELMQQVPEEAGFEFVPVRKIDTLYDDAAVLKTGDVFHLHWTQRITQRPSDEAAASAAVERFTRFVDELKSAGVRIVWTVHNRLPHDLKYLEPELTLCRFLAERADVVHVLSESTAEIVGDLYELPADRTRVIPHPSYLGVYEPTSPERARARFGLDPGERTVLAFGRMRAYKGIDLLGQALGRIAERGHVAPTLLLAGKAKAGERAEIERHLPQDSRVIAQYTLVDVEEIGDWFAAADTAVFPFRAILNSGSVHLAATLGVPVVLPGDRHLRRQFAHEPWVRFFDEADPVESLADLLQEPDPIDYSDSMAAFSQRIAPRAISQLYADLLMELTGPPRRRRRRSRRGSRS